MAAAGALDVLDTDVVVVPPLLLAVAMWRLHVGGLWALLLRMQLFLLLLLLLQLLLLARVGSAPPGTPPSQALQSRVQPGTWLWTTWRAGGTLAVMYGLVTDLLVANVGHQHARVVFDDGSWGDNKCSSLTGHRAHVVVAAAAVPPPSRTAVHRTVVAFRDGTYDDQEDRGRYHTLNALAAGGSARLATRTVGGYGHASLAQPRSVWPTTYIPPFNARPLPQAPPPFPAQIPRNSHTARALQAVRRPVMLIILGLALLSRRHPIGRRLHPDSSWHPRTPPPLSRQVPLN